ncbi:M23 family metallopeptidase [Catenovulum maritimum]|uniref:Membrane protein n=1 Tax=Catenovulum maritimum TaxID=1513271 RepID=A0A0J8GLV4_9ALTE|nr:M23 family metallopeptidase [Catenovulum maritimum]KMT63802.1 membrane protein [Catenovulum maritimum]
MSLLIQYKKSGYELSWELGFRHAFFLLLLLFSLAYGSVYSYKLFTKNDLNAHSTPFSQSKQQLAEHKAILEQLQAKTQAELAAIKLKLAELQTKALRVNALGERLADNAKLQKDEFNFALPVAVGGPAEALNDEQMQIEPVQHQLIEEMQSLLNDFNEQERQLSLLESVMLNHNISDQIYISGRPANSGWLSSYYGMRKDPFSGLPAHHKGIDFAGKEGTKVIATGAGVVTWAEQRYGYGKMVEIDHGNGFKTRYGHNKELLVSVGDIVTKGMQIAKMGSTGRSTGPHVHYEILKNGKQIDPLKYVYRKSR